MNILNYYQQSSIGIFFYPYCRDKSKKKDAGGGEEGNKPGKEAIGRVQDRLDGYVVTDKKRKGKVLIITLIHGFLNKRKTITNNVNEVWMFRKPEPAVECGGPGGPRDQGGDEWGQPRGHVLGLDTLPLDHGIQISERKCSEFMSVRCSFNVKHLKFIPGYKNAGSLVYGAVFRIRTRIDRIQIFCSRKQHRILRIRILYPMVNYSF